MEVEAFWKAKTYYYDGYVLVYSQQPDLEAIEIVATSPLMINTPVSFFYKIKNNGTSTHPSGYSIEIADETGSKKIVHTDSYPPLGGGGEQTGVFTHTFTSIGSKTLTLFADSQRKIDESDETNNKKSFVFPVSGGIAGDFDIVPSTIHYRDPFKLVPKAITTAPGCTYTDHVFRLRNGLSWTSPKQTDKTKELAFSHPSHYPSPIAVGSVQVSMRISGLCGTTAVSTPWIDKTLTVNGPSTNDPPYFKLGWFYDGDFSSTVPLTQAVEGARLMVRVVKDPKATPPTPSDPNGDSFWISGWDFTRSNDWVAKLPDKYGWAPDADYLRGIQADQSNSHTIYATMVDPFGASYTAGASITIVPPNPVPQASCPPTIKENRAVDQAKFDASKSYSPSGRSIDHSRDEWINRKTSYVNGTNDDISVQVQLWVWDNGSPPLKSLYADTCTITVQPDKPPIGKLDVPPLAIRGQSYDFFNKSYSPDGDHIVSAAYRYKYDANNNGFGDDAWQPLTGTLVKTSFSPTIVGSYLFDVTVCEDYGRCGTASDTQPLNTLTMNVVNLAPWVEFQMSGKNPQPDLNPPIPISAQTMMAWSLYETNTTKLAKNAPFKWSAKNGILTAGLGKGTETRYPEINYYSTFNGQYSTQTALFRDFSDNGFGANGISPYKPMQSRTAGYSQPILIGDPAKDNLKPVQYKSLLVSDKARIYFDVDENGNSLYALNKSRIPRYELVNVDLGRNDWGTWNGFVYKHRWKDASPYDYILTPKQLPWYGQTVPIPNFYQNDSGDWGQIGTSQSAVATGNVMYGFAGKTIYMFASKNVPKAYYSPYDGDSYYHYEMAYNLCTFKAEDGSLITCKDITRKVGTIVDPYNKVKSMKIARGDHIVLQYTDGYGGVISFAAEYDAQANLIGAYPVTGQSAYEYHTVRAKYLDWYTQSYKESEPAKYKQLACYYYASDYYEIYQNPYDNSMYQYVMKYCSSPADPDYKVSMYEAHPELQPGAYLQKLNPDFTVAWRTYLNAKGFSYDGAGGMDFIDTKPTMAINPYSREVLTRAIINWRPQNYYWDHYVVVQNAIDMDSGAIRAWTAPEYKVYNSPFHIEPDGSYAYGSCTPVTDGSCASLNYGYDQYIFRDGGVMHSNEEKLNAKQYGAYLGDGIYVSIYDVKWAWGGGGLSDGGTRPHRYLWLDKGPPTTNPDIRKGFQLGQFVSDTSHDNLELTFTLSMDQPHVDPELAGFSFRMQDAKNRYAVETDGAGLFLSRYIDGNRAVLANINFPAQGGTEYTFKLKATGNKLELTVNGVPYFDVTDGTFASGKIGPFSDKAFVNFSGVIIKAVPTQSIEWLTNYAIWEEGTAMAEVKYDSITFADPENDPRAGTNRWTYTHTPKFINNQGVSALAGATFTSEQLAFDKVGEYGVTLQARDDPNPNYLTPSMTFDAYRKQSNAYAQRLIVHRRPVAAFTAAMNPDGTVAWTDASYDPDRWASASHYSPPDTTGIDYGATRGVMERRYYYVTPKGEYVESKLTRPTQLGAYEVGLIVRDEYGAWSYPVSQTVTVGVIPAPNTRPTATLTYPAGTQPNPTLTYATKPTIAWDQHDTPGTIFQGYHVKISLESGQIVAESGERPQWTTVNGASWNVPVDLPIGTKLQVQVRVSDGEEWSAWSNVGWMIVNSPPSAVLTFPNGADAYSPNLIQDNRRPTISWNQYDIELAYGAVFQGYHVQIRNESGTVVYDTVAAQWTQAASQSMTVTADLPTGIPLKAIVRVSDGAAWSNWSNVGWMKINMSPTAVVTHPSGTQANPTIDGPLPTLVWNQADPDPGTVFVKYQIVVADEANAIVYDSGETFQNTSSNTYSHAVRTSLPPGKKLRVRVRVNDGYGWSAWSDDKWMLTNRPPMPDFDWTPKPIWEGDTVHIVNLSTDPDGDALASVWDIRSPDGQRLVHETAGVDRIFPIPGTYTVTLTVSDGFAERSVTKTLEAAPLTIRSEVDHTPQWLAIHEDKGHNTTVVPKDFYSGEVFVVSTIASPAPVAEATARIETTGIDGRPLEAEAGLDPTGDGARFEGTLFDERFLSATEGIPEGVLPIVFTIRYANGVTKTEEVPVRIIGNANEAVQVHRRQ
ncbi:CARDB domain-containing protein [Paenibacillus flagellatus]|nr:CARDB domain-containing protein [Paenibacillus flagellatus]